VRDYAEDLHPIASRADGPRQLLKPFITDRPSFVRSYNTACLNRMFFFLVPRLWTAVKQQKCVKGLNSRCDHSSDSWHIEQGQRWDGWPFQCILFWSLT